MQFLFSETWMYSYVYVARDSTCIALNAISSCRTCRVSPEMAEGMRVKEALSWLKNKQRKSIVVKTDCLTVIQSFRSPYHMLSYFGSVITEYKSMLHELSHVSNVFIRRCVNMVAHFLAIASY